MIPINGNLLTETFVSSMGILILGLMIVRMLPIKLKTFMPVYLLLVLSNIAVHYTFIENVSIFWQAGAAVIGFTIMWLCAAMYGKLKTSAHYEALVVGIGLYPWYLGWIESVIYVVSSIIMIALIYFGKQYRASKKFMISKDKFNEAEDLINKKDYPKFQKIINGIYTTPIGVAAIISVIFYSLTI